MCTKNQNHMMYGSWDTNKIYLSFWGIFLAFYPPSFLNDPEYENFDKNGKKAWRYYPFIYIHVHKWWRSYDILFLKYNVRQTEMFDILAHYRCYCYFSVLGYFLPFYNFIYFILICFLHSFVKNLYNLIYSK